MIPTKITTATRRAVYARDDHRCILCGDNRSIHLHHNILRSLGGTDTAENLVCLCPLCHAIAHGQAHLDNQFPFDKDTAQDAIHYYLEYS